MKTALRAGLIATIAARFLLADVTYDQTMRFTGGTLLDMMKHMASNPAVGTKGGNLQAMLQEQKFTVYMKDPRMAMIGPLFSVIYNSEARTITTINNTTHTYSVTTFDAIREQMQRRGMSTGEDPNKKFKITVDKPGRTRMIDGQTATEVAISMTAKAVDANGDMVVKTTAWIVPNSPATREIADFLKSLSSKYADAFIATPMFGPASIAVSAGMKESMNLEGYPAMIEMEISGLFSPLTAATGSANHDPNAPALKMELESSNFVQAPIDDSKFAIPPGYTEQKIDAGKAGH